MSSPGKLVKERVEQADTPKLKNLIKHNNNFVTFNVSYFCGNTSFGYVINRDFYSINIDEPIDALTANAFYEKLKKKFWPAQKKRGMFIF